MKWHLFSIYSLLTIISTAVIALTKNELLIWMLVLTWILSLMATLQAIHEDR